MRLKHELGESVAARGVLTFPVDNEEERILSVDISPDGELVAGLVGFKSPSWVGVRNPGIYIWRRETGEIIHRVPRYLIRGEGLQCEGAPPFVPLTARCRRIHFTQSNQLLLAEANKLSLWNMQGEKGKRFKVHGGIHDLSMSHDRRWVLTTTILSFEPKLLTLRLWDMKDGSKLSQVVLPVDRVMSFGNGQYLLALSFRGSITLHESRTGRLLQDYGNFLEYQSDLTISPNGNHALIFGHQSHPAPFRGAVILNLASGRVENRVAEMRGTFSPCGNLVVGGDRLGNVRFWAFPSGRVLHAVAPATRQEETDSAQFSIWLDWQPRLTADGGFMVSTNGSARLWEVATEHGDSTADVGGGRPVEITLRQMQQELKSILITTWFWWGRDRFLRAARLCDFKNDMVQRLTSPVPDVEQLDAAYDIITSAYRSYVDSTQLELSLDGLTHEQRIAKRWCSFFLGEVAASVENDVAVHLILNACVPTSNSSGDAAGLAFCEFVAGRLAVETRESITIDPEPLVQISKLVLDRGWRLVADDE